jgi:hypothetical protein
MGKSFLVDVAEERFWDGVGEMNRMIANKPIAKEVEANG